MFQKIMKIFTRRKPNREYWIRTSDIKISPEFAAHRVKECKLRKKKDYYYSTGVLESPIILNDNYVLIDGYSSYIIGAKIMRMDKLPVYFQNANGGANDQ